MDGHARQRIKCTGIGLCVAVERGVGDTVNLVAAPHQIGVGGNLDISHHGDIRRDGRGGFQSTAWVASLTDNIDLVVVVAPVAISIVGTDPRHKVELIRGNVRVAQARPVDSVAIRVTPDTAGQSRKVGLIREAPESGAREPVQSEDRSDLENLRAVFIAVGNPRFGIEDKVRPAHQHLHVREERQRDAQRVAVLLVVDRQYGRNRVAHAILGIDQRLGATEQGRGIGRIQLSKERIAHRGVGRVARVVGEVERVVEQP